MIKCVFSQRGALFEFIKWPNIRYPDTQAFFEKPNQICDEKKLIEKNFKHKIPYHFTLLIGFNSLQKAFL